MPMSKEEKIKLEHSTLLEEYRSEGVWIFNQTEQSTTRHMRKTASKCNEVTETDIKNIAATPHQKAPQVFGEFASLSVI